MATAPSTLNLLQFNGKNVFIDCGQLDLNNTSFTIEFWAKRQKHGEWTIAVQQGISGKDQSLHLGFRNTDVFTLAFYGDDLNTKAKYTDSDWHHWSCVYDYKRGHQEVFRDGKSVAAQGSGKLKSNNNFYIGCANGTRFFFDGFIAEVRVWKTVRTQAEIQQGMNAPLSGQEENLLAYWPLDDGKGAIAHDQSSHGNHGTIHNESWQAVQVPLQKRAQSLPGEDTLNLLQFNGKDVFIDCGKLDLNNTSFTIEFWAKRQKHGKWDVAVQQGVNGNHQCLHVGFRDIDVFTFAFHGDDLNTRATYTDNAWHYWSCVYDHKRKHQEVFCDGKSVAARGCSKLNSNSNFYIGCYEGKDCFFNGYIAEVRLWSTVRTAAEIQQAMNAQLSGREENLLAYWPLDDGQATIAKDLTGNGHDGVIHNGNWQVNDVPFPRTRDRANGNPPSTSSLMFDGKSDYISIPDSPSLNTSTYTAEVWIKTAGAVTTWSGVLGKPGRGHHIWLIQQQAFHGFHTQKDTNRYIEPPKNLFQYGQWTHIAVTNDGEAGRTYINGELKAECPNGAELVIDKTPFYIGGNLDGEGKGGFFAGQLAEIRLWNYARSPQQIKQHMKQELAGNESGLMGYWPLDEGGGSVAHDRSVNNNHGVMRGAIQSSNWQEMKVPFQKRAKSRPENEKDKATIMSESKSVLTFSNTKSPSDYFIVKPFSPSPTHAFTIEFWAKVRKNGRDHGCPFALSSPTRANEFVFFNCKKIEFYIHDSHNQGGSASLTKGQWQHCAVTWESSTGQMHLYLDGQDVFSPVLAKGLTLDTTTAVILGQDPDSYGDDFDVKQAFQGQITELRIWDYVRSLDDIKAQMNKRCTGKEKGLSGYWPLNEGEGNVAHDKTGKNHHGELHGVTWSTAEDLTLISKRVSTHIPCAQPRTNSVGLEDYAYWWKEVTKEQAAAKEQPKEFRRGRIWA